MYFQYEIAAAVIFIKQWQSRYVVTVKMIKASLPMSSSVNVFTFSQWSH
jgi:hypothetical protein